MALRLRACLGWLALLAALVPGAASAQHITIDGSLSPARTLHAVDGRYTIRAGLGRQVGGNLFQSFGLFGLAQGETATFTDRHPVANIIGRVTGGNPSRIDGTIRSNIAGANVYLINPDGVVFGPQGKVDVKGGFYASTANYLRMTDGARFRATLSGHSTLTAAAPAAFGFLNAKPPAITVDGSALTAHGRIELVGGAVSIGNGALLAAPARTIDVASVAGKGEVPVDPRHGAALTVRQFGEARIAGGAVLSVDNKKKSRHGGSVFVRAGDLWISGGVIRDDNHGAGAGGKITLRADRQITLRHAAAVRAFGFGPGSGSRVILETASDGRILVDGSAVLTASEGTGAGGTLSIASGRLALTDGAELGSIAAGTGDAGAVRVAAGNLLIDGRADARELTELGSVAFGAGRAGSVTITADSLRILANGEVVGTTSGRGDGGSLRIALRGTLSIDASGAALLTGIVADALAGSAGNAGDVTVTAGDLVLVGGAEISGTADGRNAASRASRGNAGTVTVDVEHRLTIDRSGIFSNVDAGTTGKGGRVYVTAADLRIDHGFINSNTSGRGDAGTVAVDAGTLSIRDAGQIGSGTFASGNGGQIVVVVSGTLAIDGSGNTGSAFTGIVATAQPQSTGAAGSIAVEAGRLSIVRGGTISAETLAHGPAGDVDVRVTDHAVIARNGTISSGSSGHGPAGDVSVDAGSLTVTRFGRIFSDAFAAGKAGSVSVEAGVLRLLRHGKIASDSKAGSSGNAGNVTVDARRFAMAKRGEISSSADGSRGNAGNVTVDVGGRLTIDRSGISSDVGFGSAGTGGRVIVEAGDLRIDGGGISSNTRGRGDAGTVAVDAGKLTILKAGQIGSGTFASGNGGRTSVVVAGMLAIDGSGGTAGLFTGIVATAQPHSTGQAGSIAVEAGRLSLVDGGSISAETLAKGSAGEVEVRVAGSAEIARGGEIASDSDPGSSGSAGKVLVKAQTLRIADGLISSSLLGPGFGVPASTGKRAGNIRVEVGRSLTIIGSGSGAVSGIVTDADAETIGAAGNVRVTAGALQITKDGEIGSGTFGAGAGGRVAVVAAGGVRIDGRGADPRFVTGITTQANAGSSGNAGDVFLDAGSLRLVDGGAIESAAIGRRNGTRASSGSAGEITIEVAGGLTIAGNGSQIGATTDPGTAGDAGSVVVSAGEISITDGGEVVSTTAGSGRGGSVAMASRGALVLDGGGSPGTGIAASATGPRSGMGGRVTIAAGSLMITGGAQIASTTAGPGAGGDVAVDVASGIVLSGRGPQITAQSIGSGDAGSVQISASQLEMTGAAAISTRAETSTASGGGINLVLGDFLVMQRSEITTSVAGKTGNGGDITINAPLVLLEDGNIVAKAVAGDGGNILITAGAFVASTGSVVSASSQKGVSGIVETNGVVPLNGALVVLSSELRSAVAVTRNGCAARADRPQSSLYEAGRGGLPEDPTASLPALYLAGRDLRLGPPAAASRAAADPEPAAARTAQLRCG